MQTFRSSSLSLLPAPSDIGAKPDVILRRLKRLEKAFTWKPSSSEYMVKPRVIIRVDKNGHRYVESGDECMVVLKNILDRWAHLYFSYCPRRKFGLPRDA
jgi:hypothetical protein